MHCLVIVSRLSPSIADKRDIGVHYEKLFKSCQQRYQGEGPTGLLLVYPQHCVHLVESPWEIIVQVISDLNTMEKEQWVLLCIHTIQCMHRATARDVTDMTSPIETNTQLTSAWQDQLDQASRYTSVPYSSHSARSSRISIHVYKTFFFGIQVLYTRWALQSEWLCMLCLSLPCRSEAKWCHHSHSIKLLPKIEF